MLISISRNRISVERQITIGGERNVDGGTLRNLATPIVPCTILISLRNTDTGTALVTGTNSSDQSQTETITITNSKLGQGIKLFKTISLVELTNIDSGNHIQVKYRGKDGSQVKAQNTLFDCLPCDISYSSQSWNNDKSGTVQNGKVTITIPVFCNDETQRLHAGDLITDLDSGYQFLVNGMAYIDGVGINRFQVVNAERREKTS